MNFITCQLWLVLLERREIIQYPEGATVGRRQKITALNEKVIYRRDGQVSLQRLPVCAIVPGEENSPLRAGLE